MRPIAALGLLLYGYSHSLTCMSAACDSFDPTVDAARTKVSRGSNSQKKLPRNLYFADVDGDGQSDYVQFGSNKVFASKANEDRDGISHFYMRGDIERLLIGDFRGTGWDQVCAVHGSKIECYGIDNKDHGDFKAWFQDDDFISGDQDAVVGDYDKDGKDDVLLYDRKKGTFSMWSARTPAFSRRTDFRPGNLDMVEEAGIRLTAGDWNGDGQTDLLATRENGCILVFRGVVNGDGNTTFWWSFTTASGLARSDDDILLARVDDNAKDDLVLHDRSSGSIRFYGVSLNDGHLPRLGADPEPILMRDNAVLVMAGNRSGGKETDYREDAYVYARSENILYKSSAKKEAISGDPTYGYSFDQAPPANHSGWPEVVKKTFYAARCKFQDISDEPKDYDYWWTLNKRLPAYFQDVTYGTYDLWGSALSFTWKTMNRKYEDIHHSRAAQAAACKEAAGYEGGYDGFISLVNENRIIKGKDTMDADVGASGSIVNSHPGDYNLMFWAHETAHVMGWSHSYDDTQRKTNTWSNPGEYFDRADIMSARPVDYYKDELGSKSGPGFNAMNLKRKRIIPEARILELSRGGGTSTFRLAALNRPEANGFLVAVIDVPGEDYYYTLEFREKQGFDQGLDRAAVFLHKFRNGRSILITEGWDGRRGEWEDAERTAGEKHWKDGINFEILEIDQDAHRAKVKVSWD